MLSSWYRQKWRRVQDSNPRPEGRPGFRDRLRTAAHYPPYFIKRAVNSLSLFGKTAVNSLLLGQDGREQPFVWFSRRDSNSLPSGSEPDALSNELREIRCPSSQKSCKEDGATPSWRLAGVLIPARPVDNRIATPAASQGLFLLVHVGRLERPLSRLSSGSLCQLG